MAFEKVTPLYLVRYRRGNRTVTSTGYGTLAQAKTFASNKNGAIIYKSVLAKV